ncbi:uncharacterized protein [Lolium perenne]|uniref:uncharacterized protein isoform X2 n=1 Tax=Lolium perenne TaxID=4522 RepID=UPI003A99544D
MEMAAMGKKQREEVLLYAAFEGNIRLLKKMSRGLDSGGQGEASVLAAVADNEGNCALHLAAAAGRVDVCRYIVEDLRLDANQPNFKGETPLFASAYCGGAAAARYLIDHGADPLAGKLWSPLHCAAAKGNCEILKLLLSRGIDVDLYSIRGTPLHAAALYKQDCTMKILLEHHADPNKVCSLDYTPLSWAVRASPTIPTVSLECVKLLIQFGVTPIEFAASKGRRDMVEMLFPLTSPIPTLLEWSIDGIISHVKSFGLKPRDKCKCEKRRTGLKQKAKEAFQREEYFTAAILYSNAMEFDPSPDDFATMLANRSLCSLRAGNGKTALSDATMCRSARPHWPKACYRQGAAFMLMKDYEKACEAFADGLKLDPTNGEIAKALREAREAAKNAC